MGYNFTTKWIKGALNNTPDALARHPVTDPLLHVEHDLDNEPGTSIAEIRVISGIHESFRLEELCRHADQD